MHDIFDRKRVISLVHFIGKHQLVTGFQPEFLGCGTGDHRLIFPVAGLHREIRIVVIDSQHCHIQIVAVGLLFQALRIGRRSALRHLLGRIFVSIHKGIGRLIQTGHPEIFTQDITVY